ncbi:hypothetical protein [Streptomyces sp. NPDC002402]
MVHTPLFGRVATGAPITAAQHVEEVLALPEQLADAAGVLVGGGVDALWSLAP